MKRLRSLFSTDNVDQSSKNTRRKSTRTSSATITKKGTVSKESISTETPIDILCQTASTTPNLRSSPNLSLSHNPPQVERTGFDPLDFQRNLESLLE